MHHFDALPSLSQWRGNEIFASANTEFFIGASQPEILEKLLKMNRMFRGIFQKCADTGKRSFSRWVSFAKK
jgi:hypothetical protein